MSPLPAYERPLIIRHESGLMNKFSRVQSMRPMTHLDGVAVAELMETYGSPLFVFSEKTLVERYRELRDVFSLRYPKVRIAWSYKTNYLDSIARVFHKEGAWAEVVSMFEWEKARNLGVPAEQIHFNGPYKPKAVLDEVLPAGTIIHIDHFDELAAAERVAVEKGIRPKVAIRINLTADGTPQWSRFGFNLENGQAHDAVMRILTGDRLELTGLHCHLGTFILDPDAYRQSATKMVDFANRLRQEQGITLSFVDVGGGFASHNTLKAQYLPGDQATPSFSRYAEAISDALGKLNYPPREMPTLVLETGRALVDDAGYLIATVQANKRLPDGRRALIVDAGVNVLFTSFWYKHDVVPAQEFRGVFEPTILYGPLCMNIDVVRDTLLFPPLNVGDQIVFRTVGAYNVTQWMQFITYRPAVVLISQNGQHAAIRKREDLEIVRGPEQMAPWL
ncbi:MAG: diaminopimelate decarboxylase [Deltaproteobacteria bacterium RIFOXYB12_FULL_58_9]|nr:MAG: diaminopimelate decarboxylase [Deltaproteobacteria bacterium RIFOXYB12_FULL_58_9]